MEDRDNRIRECINIALRLAQVDPLVVLYVTAIISNPVIPESVKTWYFIAIHAIYRQSLIHRNRGDNQSEYLCLQWEMKLFFLGLQKYPTSTIRREAEKRYDTLFPATFGRGTFRQVVERFVEMSALIRATS